MRIAAFLSILASAASGQVPATDSRATTLETKTHFVMPEYKTLAQWETRKARLKMQILGAAGLLPMPARSPLHAKIFGRIEHPDYSIEKVFIESMPGFYLGGNLYRPTGKPGKRPGVLSPHGHWLYGRLEHQPLVSAPARAINLARQGYVVFSYDMVGINDTNQTPHKFGTRTHQLWSFGPFGLQLWNSIRALDFLESLEDVDAQRLAVTGESGGGTQTFMLAAVDDRVRFDAPVNMVSGIMQGGCVCENAPGLRFDASNLEIAAMMAPRPMLLVSATGDWTVNVPREEFPAIRKIYELYGKPENVEVVQIDAPHNYNKDSRQAVYAFFGKHILGEDNASKLKEKSSHLETLQDMLVFYGRPAPASALTFDGIFEQWKANCRRQVEGLSDRAAVREGLRSALGVEFPGKVLSSRDGERVVLSREGKGDRVSGIWTEGKGAPVLLVHPDGSATARSLAPDRLRPALLIDAFPIQRDQTHQHFLTFNRGDNASRVQDILTALAFLHASHPGKIELRGVGKAAIWCLFAAAVSPVEVILNVDLKGFHGTDEEFLQEFFVPGIQRAGGLPAALMLTSSQPQKKE